MSEFYYYLWAIYAVSGIGLLFLSWRLFRCFKVPEITLGLVALVAALLFTPVKLLADQTDLTPALVVLLLDGLVEGWPGVWGGLKYVLLVYLALLLVLVPIYLIKLKFTGKSTETAETASTE